MSETTKKHKALAPKCLNFGIFICSTSRYQLMQNAKDDETVKDASGEAIETLVRNAGHNVLFRTILADDKTQIREAIEAALSSASLDVAIFCGGTGITRTDVTIETVSPFFEKTLPGFGEIFRRLSYDNVGSPAIMSRAAAGVIGGKVFFCIPGSPNAVKISVERLILPEAPHIVKHARE